MGGKSSAPAAPDYTGAAQQQAQASKEITNMQTWANRPTINTPFGTQSWQAGSTIDPATGQPVTNWTQNTTLAPGMQSALESQIGVQKGRSDLAGGFMDRVSQEYGSPFDWQNLPQMARSGGPAQLNTGLADYTPGLQTGINFDTNYRDRVAGDLMTRMQPVHERQQSQLETQLANQGFNVGTEGYTRALSDLQGRQASERYNALDSAGSEAQRLFNMEQAKSQFGNQALGQAASMDQSRMGAMNSAMGQQQGLNQQASDYQNRLRQQAIAEQMQRRGMSLNEMNAVLSGQQVGMPQMPSFNTAQASQTPNLMGAMQSGYDAQLGAYNANQAGNSNFMGGLFSLGGAALSNPMTSAFMFSDARLKSDIVKVGEHPIGVGIYEYTMLGMPQRGVIAQEVQRVRPDLVQRHANGYLTVNYGGL